MDRVDEILALPPDEFGPALGAYLQDHWRGLATEARRAERCSRLEACEARRRLLQRDFLALHLGDLQRLRNRRWHEKRSPLQLRRVSKGLRRALARRVELVG